MSDKLNDKLGYIQEKIDEVSDLVHRIDKEVALQKNAFDDHLDQDERMYQEFKRMNDILQQNTDSLKEHMHRTELLESIVTKMDERLSPMELEHLKKTAVRSWVKDNAILLAKIFGAISAVAGVWMLIQPWLTKILG